VIRVARILGQLAGNPNLSFEVLHLQRKRGTQMKAKTKIKAGPEWDVGGRR
jgi:hypothetical protein